MHLLTPLHQKRTYYFITLLIAALVLLLPSLLFAADQDPDGRIQTWLAWIAWLMATYIGGMVISIGGGALDWSIRVLVLEMGTLLSNDIGVAVNSVWVVIRDTFNLVFIFALVYIGLRIIWDAGDGGAKRNLARLIVAALLINFSLFFAKVIVDMGNIAAIQIYSLYGNVLVQTTASNTVQSALQTGIAAYVIHHLGYTDIASGQVVGGAAQNSMGLGLMVLLFFLVTGFVFLAGAIMMVGRFVLLCVYLMFAPFMFIGLIIPNFGSYQTQWWKGFLKQVFVAPAFLFTTYIALRIITVASTGTSSFNGGFAVYMANNAGGGPDAGGILLIMVALGFMILALSLSNKMGAVGAATSIKVGQNIRQRGQRFAGAATAGMAARAGRNTVGYGAQKLADNDRFKSITARSGTIGRGLYNTTQKVADSSFDARQVAGVGTALGVGTGKKGGYATRVKEDKKRDEAFIKATATKLSDEEINKRTNSAKLQDTNYRARAQERADAESQVTKLRQNLTQQKVDFSADEAEIEELKRKLAGANPIKAEEIKNEIATKSGALEQMKQQSAANIASINTQIKTAEAEVKKADSTLKEAENSVRAKVEHANQIAYINSMESTARWQKKIAIGVGAAAGATLAVLAAPAVGVAAGAAAVGGAVAGVGGGYVAGRSGAYQTTSIQADFIDEYGKDKSGNVDGSKKKKTEGERKRIKALAEEVAKANDADSKKDDVKDDGAA
jgi:hypothetical protein